jgi:hypothetical protein
MAGAFDDQDPATRKLGQTSFSKLNQFTKAFAQSRGKFIGDLDSHVYLTELYGTDVGPVHLRLLSKGLLGQT